MRIKQGIILIFLLLTSICLKAGNNELVVFETKPTVIGTNLKIDNISASTYWNDFTAKIELNYTRKELSDIAGTTDWSYRIVYDLKAEDASGNTIIELTSSVLEINTAENLYIDLKQLESLKNLNKIQLEISSICVNSNCTNPLFSDIPNDINLSLIVSSSNIIEEFSSNSELKGVINDEKLDLHWKYIDGAVKYELQWTYINHNDDNFALYSGGGFNDFESVFEYREPVNVIITDQDYDIGLSYSPGIIFCRLRPIGLYVDAQDRKYDRTGNWTYANTPFLLDASITNPAFEIDKIWSLEKVYAEDGKSKEVISYYDETSKNIQSITNLSTDENILVSETIYDFEGRPVINMLPVPIKSQSLRYKDGISGLEPEDLVYDFEQTSTNPTPIYPLELDPANSILSNYYSPTNNISQFENKVNLKYIPDAEGYPYSQVQYMNDNTGRIVAQSGIGEEFKMGSGHETKIYYNTPKPNHLHQLFGSNVGDASHYKEIKTKDPNGQYSIAYLDQEGRTIATFLSGVSPSNLEALEYNVPEVTLDKLKTVDEEANAEHMYASYNIIHNESDLTYSFNYDMESFLSDGNTCYNCRYNLNIYILNSEGEKIELTIASPVSAAAPHFEVNELLEPSCSDGGTYELFGNDALEFTADLEEGTYTIIKKLTVLNDFEISEELKEELASLHGIPTLAEYIEGQISLIDWTQCDPEEITDISDINLGDFGISNFEEILQESQEQSCLSNRLKMLEQLNPGGEYFEDGSFIWNALEALFNDHSNNAVLSQDFYDEFPQVEADFDLDFDNLMELYEDDFLKVHPEYCHLQLCELLSTNNINSFDVTMRMIDGWTSASTFSDNGTTYDLTTFSGLAQYDPLLSGSFTDPFEIDGVSSIIFEDFDDYDFNAYIDAQFSDYEYYDNDPLNISPLTYETFVQTGVPINTYFDPYTNSLVGVPSISISTPSGATIINPIYLNVDPSDIERMHFLFYINAYIVIRNRAINNFVSSINCDFLDEEYAVFEDVNFGSSTNPALSPTDAQALAQTYCEDDAQTLADMWQGALYDLNFLDDASMNATSIQQLNTDLKDYLVGEYCTAVSPDISIFPWPAIIPIHEIVSMPCISNVPSLGNIFNNTNSMSLSLQSFHLTPQVHPFFKAAILNDVTSTNTFSTSYFDFANNNYSALISSSDVAESSFFFDNATQEVIDANYDKYYNHYGFFLDRINSWMALITSNCEGLSDETQADVPEALEAIEILLTTFLMDNYHLLNRNVVIDQTTLSYCYNDYTLGEVASILEYFGCGIEQTITNYELFNVNGCPFVSECGESFIEMFNTEVFGGTSGTVVSTGFLSSFDLNCGGTVSSVEVGVSSTGANPPPNFLTVNHQGCVKDYYLVDECGNNLAWYNGMQLVDEFIATSGFPEIPGSHFTGLAAQILYPTGVTNPCNQELVYNGTTYVSPVNIYLMAIYNPICDNTQGDIPVDNNYSLTFSIPCPEFEEENPCEDNLILEATQQAILDWELLLENIVNSYYGSMIEQCYQSNPQEEFTVSYLANRYHYTLYYYDQSGNLTQTVPPEGVELLDMDPTENHFDTYANYLSGEPEHRLKTNYKYNSLNQLVWQKTPDGGVSSFWYDKKGQLKFSRNEQQLVDNAFSYTKYDYLGRISEVGQVTDAEIGGVNDKIQTSLLSYSLAPKQYYNYVNDSNVPDYSGSHEATEITATYYNGDYSYDNSKENYRNRVSAVAIFDNELEKDDAENNDLFKDYMTPPLNDIGASFYKYDILGNVVSLVQHVEDFEDKEIEYEFDVLSGNVNKVSYQNNQEDAFHHQYEYDADNRLTNTYSSRDNIIWEEEAEYFYYPHGPLARVEIGDDKIQGLDYYYTIQGWLKGVNRPLMANEFRNNALGQNQNINYNKDEDGTYYAENKNKYATRDEFNFNLGYYEGDYKAISNALVNTGIERSWPRDNNDLSIEGLYNGNIKTMFTDIPKFYTETENGNQVPDANYFNDLRYKAPRLGIYSYDQLNRIKESTNSYLGIGCGTTYTPSPNGDGANFGYYDYSGSVNLCLNNNTLTPFSTEGSMHKTTYDYDKNGNLEDLKRWSYNKSNVNLPLSDVSNAFDNFYYRYQELAGNKINNQLQHVNDFFSNDAFLNTDIDDQGSMHSFGANYEYDAIGNLIKDRSEKISNIDWTVYGKVRSVQKNDPDLIYQAFNPNIQYSSDYNVLSGYNLDYKYDAMGNRTSKNNINVLSNDVNYVDYGGTRTFYVRDASGNIMATYNKEYQQTGTNFGDVTEDPNNRIEYNIYGSSRIGVYSTSQFDLSEIEQLPATRVIITSFDNLVTNVKPVEVINNGDEILLEDGITIATVVSVNYVTETGIYSVNILEKSITQTLWKKGRKSYELSNHLGNVMVVVSDKRKGQDDGTGKASHYLADVVSAQDYYPFGSTMPGRSFTSQNYRFGFGGQEKDDEVAGEGNSYTATFWQYDSRLGRRWNVDPVTVPYESPYAAFRNNPIVLNDPNGDCSDCPEPSTPGEKEGQQATTFEETEMTNQGVQQWFWHNGNEDGEGKGWKTKADYQGYLDKMMQVSTSTDYFLYHSGLDADDIAKNGQLSNMVGRAFNSKNNSVWVGEWRVAGTGEFKLSTDYYFTQGSGKVGNTNFIFDAILFFGSFGTSKAVEKAVYTSWNKFQAGTAKQFATRAEAAAAWAIYKEANNIVIGTIRSQAVKRQFLIQAANSNMYPKWMNQWLKKGKVPPGYHVDHIKALFDGGLDVVENLKLKDIATHINRHRYYRLK